MRKIVAAGMIGNGLEWYDFALYGYFAHILGKLFIPSTDVYAQMLGTYGIFAAGFFMRPIGAILFGYLGDKYGRKFSLTLSMVMMALSTSFIAVLPTYEQIGILAPIFLTIIRLVQGLSLAGEFSGSIAFTVEHAKTHHRGLIGSTTIVSLCLGMLLGSLTATIFSAIFTTAELESFGWRIPFIMGIFIAVVGFYIRHNTEESPHYEKAKSEESLAKTPVREAITKYYPNMLRAIGIYFSVTVPFYTLTVFLNGYIVKQLGVSIRDAYFISTVSMVIMTILLPATALLTDLYGRRKVLSLVLVAYFICSVPIFSLLNNNELFFIFSAILLFTIIVAFYIGAIPALLVESFPTKIRYSGMALSYNIAGIIGGLTPMIGTWLIEHTKTPVSIGVLIMCCSAISIISFIGYKDRYKDELH